MKAVSHNSVLGKVFVARRNRQLDERRLAAHFRRMEERERSVRYCNRSIPYDESPCGKQNCWVGCDGQHWDRLWQLQFFRLMQALRAGTQRYLGGFHALGGLHAGAALRVESLEATLSSVTFDASHLREVGARLRRANG